MYSGLCFQKHPIRLLFQESSNELATFLVSDDIIFVQSAFVIHLSFYSAAAAFLVPFIVQFAAATLLIYRGVFALGMLE